jgi:hypothetical protein
MLVYISIEAASDISRYTALSRRLRNPLDISCVTSWSPLLHPVLQSVLVQEETVSALLNHPFQTLLEIVSRHRAATHNDPFMRADCI